jgi:hypothetical protein
MNLEDLKQFDLSFPSPWIEGKDRDWASDNQLALRNVISLFEEAVAAFWKFDPITAENYKDKINESTYSRCLNSIYARAFVYALDGINKILSSICTNLHPPKPVKPLKQEYKKRFGHLKHIRDSAIHIENRGLGKDKEGNPLNTNIIILGSFIERRFAFTGNDGKQYEIEISGSTLITAKDIIQKVIESYDWID